ncbi:unnamed protein product [Arctia plantaginis]|uniref:Uncharacterized protein n=1 Tax=Arctia plantaginis TaxID=874455 RepID=A0A8S1B6I2_ARCPL|nr:unnamed protein product [Arctia plantaginis]CAB3255213.1 unnamed protein product [Arctia plantaginis]
MALRLAGWFSACGCRGGALAAARGSIAALLRARAFALVSPRALSAYRARPTSESGRVGAQYERAAARPGTPLRLAGVFADGSKAKAPKYAQLIDPQGNVIAVCFVQKNQRKDSATHRNNKPFILWRRYINDKAKRGLTCGDE